MPFPLARGSNRCSFLCHPGKADTPWLCKTLLIQDVLNFQKKNTLFFGLEDTHIMIFETVFSPPAAWDKVVCVSAQQYLIYNPLNTCRKETCLVQVNGLCEDLGSILLLQQVQGCAEQDVERGQLQLHGSLLHLDLATGTQQELTEGRSWEWCHPPDSLNRPPSFTQCWKSQASTVAELLANTLHSPWTSPSPILLHGELLFIQSHKVKTRGNPRKLKDTTIKKENKFFTPGKLSWRTPCLKILLLCQLATLYKN